MIPEQYPGDAAPAAPRMQRTTAQGLPVKCVPGDDLKQGEGEADDLPCRQSGNAVGHRDQAGMGASRCGWRRRIRQICRNQNGRSGLTCIAFARRWSEFHRSSRTARPLMLKRYCWPHPSGSKGNACKNSATCKLKQTWEGSSRSDHGADVRGRAASRQSRGEFACFLRNRDWLYSRFNSARLFLPSMLSC